MYDVYHKLVSLLHFKFSPDDKDVLQGLLLYLLPMAYSSKKGMKRYYTLRCVDKAVNKVFDEQVVLTATQAKDDLYGT